MNRKRDLVFISFRRIRYHEASFVYRDLMFSGFLPWLSDHCINTEQALNFLENYDALEPFLIRTISESEYAFIIADKEYFESKWTLLEFKEILNSKIPAEIVLFDNSEIPDHFNTILNKNIQIHKTIKSALNSICERNRKTLFPFASRFLFFHSKEQAYLFDFEFSSPSWYEFELRYDFEKHFWHNHYGDMLWFSSFPIKNKVAKDIFEINKANQGLNNKIIYNLFEDELWYQVIRIQEKINEDFRLIGYHKFELKNIKSTAVAVSIQCTASGGFCRFASIIDLDNNAKIQIIYFIKGSLQRFHTLVPDMDEIITSLGNNITLNDKNFETKGLFNKASNFSWIRCSICKNHLEYDELLDGICKYCGNSIAECMSVHCNKRKKIDFSRFLEEVDNIERELQPRDQSQGTLCEGCLSSLYIPSNIITKLQKVPKHGMPIIWNQRSSLFIIWLILCSYGLLFNTGSIYKFILGTFSIFIVAEAFIYGKVKDHPISKFNKRLHIFTIMPFFICENWIYATSTNSVQLAFAGSIIVFILGLRSFGLIKRERKTHLMVSSICASLYFLLLSKNYNPILNQFGLYLTIMSFLLTLITSTYIFSIFGSSKLAGQFKPNQFWE